MQADGRAVVAVTDVTRRHDTYRQGMLVISAALDTAPLVVGMLVILTVLVVLRRHGTAAWLASVVGIGTAGGPILKYLIGRQRPVLDQPVAEFSGLSFPSGHAGGATLAGGALLVVGWSALGRAGRWVAVCAVVLATGMSAWSRLALGGHFPSDLVGGFLFGVAWLAAWQPMLGRAMEAYDRTPRGDPSDDSADSEPAGNSIPG